MSAATSTWAAGDYPAMAERLLPVAEACVRAAGAGPGTSLLDVGCGTGNAALAAARAGARAAGVDPTPELLALARERAAGEALAVEWLVGEAEALPVADESFDAVVTVFGAMYAPDPERAAAELVRACRRGGRVVSAAWVPDGLMAATSRALAPYLPPPPPGGGPPTRWGEEGFAGELLGRHGAAPRLTRELLELELPSLEQAARFWVRTAGHVQAERARLEREGRWQELHAELERVLGAAARPGAGGGVLIPLEYLLAVGERR